MSFHRLSRNALAGVAQVVGSAFILFELYRFLVHELGPAQMGVWSLVVASTSIARLAEFGLGGGIVKFIAGDLGAGCSDRAASTVGMAACAIGGVIGIVCLLAMPMISWVLARVVTDPGLLPYALALLPWALAGLWLTAIGNVFISTLDACQRSTQRAIVMIGGAVLQLVAAYVMVPRHGVLGMGPIQVLQAAVTLLASLVLTRVTLGQPWRAWWHVDKTRFSELVRYGGRLQLAAFGQSLFDPLVKALMARFGGLAATGYFEMANRAIAQFRAVIVAAYQMLVPYLAAKASNAGLSESQVRSAYLPAYRLLFVVVTPFFAALGTVLPLLLTVWLGRFDTQFVLIGFICLAGWYINTLTAPAYMFYLAVGRLRWIMWSHLAIGMLNVALGLTGGFFFGALGVVAGGMAALALGSWITPVALHSEYRIGLSELAPSSSMALFAACTAGLIWTARVTSEWQGRDGLPWLLVTGTFITVALYAGLVWRHPAARDLFSRMRTK